MFKPRVGARERVASTLRQASTGPAWAPLGLALLTACTRAPAPEAQGRRAEPPREAGERWVATWAASPELADPDDSPLRIAGQTVRQIVHVSAGGARVRVRVSNAYGASALDVGSAHLAVHGSGPSIVAGSDRALTFGGSPGVSIPPGALVVSDPVLLSVAASSDLAVSLYLPGSLRVSTEHSMSQQTTYLSLPGDFCGAQTLADPRATQSWYFVSGVEVEAPASSRAIVALGDSITDGNGSTGGANHRWPDFLAGRLNASHASPLRAVVNAGISGNRVLRDGAGVSALARLDRDVLAQSGVKYVIVLEGINDIGAHRPGEEITADQLIAGHRQIIVRAHALGLKAFGGTLTPFEGTKFPGYYTPAGDAMREALNTWIRTSREYDAVIDFDRATRDPSHPARLLAAYDCGDHLHPSDAGYQAMAEAIDLTLFDGARD